MKEKLKEIVKELPMRPGVYLYKDTSGSVIYVGKAKNLRSRVGSYFHVDLDPLSKTAALVAHINTIEHIEAETEFEALVLEAELIKKYRPKYNIMLKDDKTFLYVVFRKKLHSLKSGKVSFNVVCTARKSDLDKISGRKTILGPYPDGRSAKEILRMLRKVFPYADCSPAKFTRHGNIGRPCLFGHIGLCLAPCVDTSKKTLSRVDSSVSAIKKILQGRSSEIIRSLKKSMDESSKAQDYEQAKKFRDLISKFEYLRQDFNMPDEYIENPYLVSDIVSQSLEDIKEAVPFLAKLPERIECYDISNVSGKDAVASMVVATNGRIDKSQYRRFKIKLKDEPDDFMMMREALSRRLRRRDWVLPELIVLDGGKGQLTTVLKVMDELGVFVPCIGIAKKQETLVFRNNDVLHEIKLSDRNQGLKLIIQLRDEAHRFAQAYHHKLRLKSIK